MYSLSIHFGPNAVVWALLFKEVEKAGAAYNAWVASKMNGDANDMLLGCDDFGQSYAIPFDDIHGMLLEDLELTDEAKILRSLANARCEVKARSRASTDPVIRSAQQGTGVLQPRFNG